MKIHVEIYIGSRILGKNQPSFSTEDLIRFIQKEFGDNRPGVTTHASAVCVANAPLNHPAGYNYLWRLGRSDLRPFRSGSDKPNPERANYRSQPEILDMPEKYRYLLQGE
jgi:hypothetical protein